MPAADDFIQPVVQSDRGVRLEPLALSHEAGLREAAADGELWKLRITSVPEPEQTRAYIEAALQMRAEGHRLAFAVVHDTTGRVLGSTSYHDIVPALKRVEIGWTWYARDVWATKVNPACKRLMLGHAFEALGAVRVSFRTDARNQRSHDAILRLGAVKEGVLRKHKKVQHGFIRDTSQFSILAEEWPAVRAGLDARLAG